MSAEDELPGLRDASDPWHEWHAGAESRNVHSYSGQSLKTPRSVSPRALRCLPAPRDGMLLRTRSASAARGRRHGGRGGRYHD
eukprot:2761454-Alexandrium_andersonii.AAC.1